MTQSNHMDVLIEGLEGETMGLRINTNLAALKANSQTRISTRDLDDTFAKITTGSRITKAADDAAGLAISENLRAQIRGLGQATNNAQNAISMVQVGEGALQEVTNNLIRLRELAIQASSDNVGEEERGFLNLEYQQILDENQRITNTTMFGRVPLLTGEGEQMEFQVGLNNDDFNDRIGFDSSMVNTNNDNLNVDGTGIADKEDARGVLSNIDQAIQQVASFRAIFGAVQSRLQSTTNYNDIATENLAAANSRLRDADIAVETSKLASQQIKQQAAVSVQAQANNQQALALRLLG